MAATVNPFNVHAFDGNEDDVRQALFELQQQFAIHQAQPDSEDRVFTHKMEEMMEDIVEDLVETEEHAHDQEAAQAASGSIELSKLSGAELERLIKREKKLKKGRSRDKKTPRSPRSPKSPRKALEGSGERKLDALPRTRSKDWEKEKRHRTGSKKKKSASAENEVSEAGEASDSDEDPTLSPSPSAEMLSSSPSKYKYAAYKARARRPSHCEPMATPEPVTTRYAARESLDITLAQRRAKNKEKGRKKDRPALGNLLVKGVMGYLPFRTSHLSGLGD